MKKDFGKQNLQTEIDASFLYQKLADNESDETVAHVFRQMSEIEKSHAQAFAKTNNSGRCCSYFWYWKTNWHLAGRIIRISFYWYY